MCTCTRLDGFPGPSSFSRRNSRLIRTDSILSRRASAVSFATSTTPLGQSLRAIGLTPSEARSATKCLTVLTPDDGRWGMLTAAKHESPDRWLLRYLGFCKWNVGKAFVQVLEALCWRMKEIHVEDQLLPAGELFALQQSQGSSRSSGAELEREFLGQLRKGKCFVRGVDRWDHPLCVLRVRLHRPDQETEASLHRLITHLIESARLLIAPPVESATVIFDMTDITRANMEFATVKFIIRCFVSYYPQTLGTLLIHNAPRMCTGIWKVIKNWIDADVATKIHFTKSVDDLAQFIPPSRIISELGGDEEWEYEYPYIEPEADENHPMKDYETRDSLLLERQVISEELFSLASQWIEATRLHDSEQITIHPIASSRSN
ncbi:CRAL-TRIO domain-containing protein [Aspergillus clavatus NRRL 1]|uniref:CRAL/TRIO domain protein n=1 Tax=Aspergillus clavatus (strain ATCC 1007 / CBS 513.65 / DSM 816 / NCTC 3887 / NRRL 1 / QM 1276 / 107) TaxID=344612 RepID=A1CE11_ASPCL|nr:CRAL/TRIO domain protein [Aspergillus clavatus NRRL 1]EAW12088.1 CRAL/TRIO domain protein [Aspergillus clavatus NRRL 1]